MKLMLIPLSLFLAAAAGTVSVAKSPAAAEVAEDIRIPTNKTAAAPLLTEKYEYYEINGCTEHELHCDLKNKCIREKNGMKFDSLTSWDVKWDYDHKSATGTCAADSFRITAEILYRYPKWKPTEKIPRTLVEKWARYMKNLVLHESGHRDRVVTVATSLNRAVSELPPASTCAEFDRKVRALSREWIKKLEEEQKRYDEETRHGASQGAIFPCECSLANMQAK